MKNRFYTAIIAALVFCVTEASASGGPPARLPMMGSASAFRNWIVTNQQVYAYVTIQQTNDYGIWTGPGSARWKWFSSERGYQDYISSTGWKLFTNNVALADPNKPLCFYVTASYYLPDLIQDDVFLVMKYEKLIGLPSTITTNSFVNNVPTEEYAYVNVQGLQRFKVEVSGLYSYSWPADAGHPPAGSGGIVPPPELTTNNYVVLNPWYSMGTNETEVRIWITANGKTTCYTQFGDPLDPPTVALVPDNKVFSTFARGAIVSMQTSTDLVHWTTFTNFSDKAGVGSISLTRSRNLPQEFFRVAIQ